MDTVRRMIDIALHYTDEYITIGGGEPTLHPDFFEILKICLYEFDYVWLATNGSQTDTMFRLSDIIDGADCPDVECDCLEEYGEEEFEEYGCRCYEKFDYHDNIIHQEDKLSVALSQDCFHDPINERVENLWKSRSNNGPCHYEVRNVQASHDGVIAQGRAIKTGSGWNYDECVCGDHILRPDGKIKLCGCTRAPIIGDVYCGIDEDWKDRMDRDDNFDGCFKTLTKRGR